MNADSLVDVLSILIRSRPLNETDRFLPLVMELLRTLQQDHPAFPQLRAAIELHFPSEPFLRAATLTRKPVPPFEPDDLVQEFIARVIGMGQYEVSHPDGIVNFRYGDFHLSLREHPYPVSIARGEMTLLRELLAGLSKNGPLHMLEIGTGFGVSSTFLAFCTHAQSQPYTLTTIDPFIEDRQTDHSAVESAETADAIDHSHNLSYQSAQALRWEFAELAIEQILDYSPRCFERTELAGRSFDVVFIDGNHFGDQPAQDFFGCLPFTHDATVFALHDSHAEGVQRLLTQLPADQWRIVMHSSSCNLSIVTRVPA